MRLKRELIVPRERQFTRTAEPYWDSSIAYAVRPIETFIERSKNPLW